MLTEVTKQTQTSLSSITAQVCGSKMNKSLVVYCIELDLTHTHTHTKVQTHNMTHVHTHQYWDISLSAHTLTHNLTHTPTSKRDCITETHLSGRMSEWGEALKPPKTLYERWCVCVCVCGKYNTRRVRHKTWVFFPFKSTVLMINYQFAFCISHKLFDCSFFDVWGWNNRSFYGQIDQQCGLQLCFFPR